MGFPLLIPLVKAVNAALSILVIWQEILSVKSFN